MRPSYLISANSHLNVRKARLIASAAIFACGAICEATTYYISKRKAEANKTDERAYSTGLGWAVLAIIFIN
jgi:hypothetical protein